MPGSSDPVKKYVFFTWRTMAVKVSTAWLIRSPGLDELLECLWWLETYRLGCLFGVYAMYS